MKKLLIAGGLVALGIAAFLFNSGATTNNSASASTKDKVVLLEKSISQMTMIKIQMCHQVKRMMIMRKAGLSISSRHIKTIFQKLFVSNESCLYVSNSGSTIFNSF